MKKSIINHAIKKRNKNNQFDYQKAEDFSLDGINDPLINNSYYFSAHSEELSIYFRLGKRCHQDETWFVIFYKNKVYSLKKELFPNNKSPLKIYKKNDNWLVEFKGILNDKDEITCSMTFKSQEKPINFSSDMPSIRMAVAMANEKWKKSFFKDLDNIQGQTHYEQEGILSGQFVLNGESVSFSLPCVRDHSFGKREWDYMNNHLWLMSVSKEQQFNYSLVSYPVMSLLEVGNYRYLDNKQRYLLSASYDLKEISKGNIPSAFTLKVNLDDSSEIIINSKILATITYHFEDGKYILHENIAEYEIDGKRSRGIFEIGFNKDSKRYFNNRNIERLKRK